MAPIYESDLAENRWKEAEWHYFEFWEETEKRARRRRLVWIGLTAVLFLVLTAWPVVRERKPLWAAQDLARRFALEVNRIKGEASLRGVALRLRFDPEAAGWVLEQAPNCGTPSVQWTKVRTVEFAEAGSEAIRLVPPARGLELGQPGLVDQVCYDPLLGLNLAGSPTGLLGVGFAPESDLAQGSLDRSFVLLVSGSSGEPQL